MEIVYKINESLLNEAPELPRGYIGASSIGHPCNRKIWYQYNGFNEVGLTTNQKINFRTGKLLEGMIIDLVQEAGFIVERPYSDNDYLACHHETRSYFKGHADAILHHPVHGKVIFDVKTCKNSSFNQFVKHGLMSWNEEYFAQLQSYMGFRLIRKSFILALNKDTSALHEEWIDFDEFYYMDLADKARYIESLKDVPPRLKDDPSYYVCQMCNFKQTCFKG